MKVLKLVLLMSVFATPGCTFAVPQAESAIRWVQNLNQGSEENAVNQQPVWFASVGEHGAVVKPYTSGDFIVFANTDGDAITFDGWIVRSITGFGLTTPLSISGKEGVRTFVSDGAVSKVGCGSWIWRQPVWRQRCDQGASEIVLDDAGNIQQISMGLDEKARFVTLRVAN